MAGCLGPPLTFYEGVTVARKPKAQQEEDGNPAPPKTTAITVPALGQSVTIRALTKDELRACFPVPFVPTSANMNTATVNIICKGVVSEQLTPELVWKVFHRFGDGPLIRIGKAITALSGVADFGQMTALPTHPR